VRGQRRREKTRRKSESDIGEASQDRCANNKGDNHYNQNALSRDGSNRNQVDRATRKRPANDA
jgi:hypothetical protein